MAALSLVRRVRAIWAPRLVALVIAIELGLLSPFSCVIHCVIQERLPEHSAIGRFLCGDHPGVLSPQAAVPHPAAPITLRAFYELVCFPLALIVAVSLLVAILTAPPARRLIPRLLMPPTPPPRTSHA